MLTRKEMIILIPEKRREIERNDLVGGTPVFRQVLGKFFDGKMDADTENHYLSK